MSVIGTVSDWINSAWDSVRNTYRNHPAGYWNEYPRYAKFSFLVLGMGCCLTLLHTLYRWYASEDSKLESRLRKTDYRRGRPLLELKSSGNEFGKPVYAGPDNLSLLKDIFDCSALLIKNRNNQAFEFESLAYHWDENERLKPGGLGGSDIVKSIEKFNSDLISKLECSDVIRKYESVFDIYDTDTVKLDYIGKEENQEDVSLAMIQLEWVTNVYKLLTRDNNRIGTGRINLSISILANDRQEIIAGLNKIRDNFETRLKSNYPRQESIDETRLKPNYPRQNSIDITEDPGKSICKVTFGSPIQEENQYELRLHKQYVDLLDNLKDGMSYIVSMDSLTDDIRVPIYDWDRESESNRIRQCQLSELSAVNNDIRKDCEDVMGKLSDHNRGMICFKEDENEEGTYRLRYDGSTEGNTESIVERFNTQLYLLASLFKKYIFKFRWIDYDTDNNPHDLVRLMTNDIPTAMNDYLEYLDTHPIENAEEGNDREDSESNRSGDNTDYRLIPYLSREDDAKGREIPMRESDMIHFRLTMEDYRSRISKGEKPYLPAGYSDKHFLEYLSLERVETLLSTGTISRDILFDLRNDEDDFSIVRFEYSNHGKDYQLVDTHLKGIEARYAIIRSLFDEVSGANEPTDSVKDLTTEVRKGLSLRGMVVSDNSAYRKDEVTVPQDIDQREDQREEDDRESSPLRHSSMHPLSEEDTSLPLPKNKESMLSDPNKNDDRNERLDALLNRLNGYKYKLDDTEESDSNTDNRNESVSTGIIMQGSSQGTQDIPTQVNSNDDAQQAPPLTDTVTIESSNIPTDNTDI